MTTPAPQTRRRHRAFALLPAALATLVAFTGCASAPPAAPLDDPLPRLFPLRLAAEPGAVGAFALREQRRDTDPYVGWWLLYQRDASAFAPALRLQVRLWLDGAFVDAMQALDSQQGRAEAQLSEWLRLHGDTLSDETGRRLWQVATADGDRHGRRLLFATSGGRQAALDNFFLDPFALSIYGSDLPEDFVAPGGGLDQFAAALVAKTRVEPAVLCGAETVVVPVGDGLSNVSSNGRLIFFNPWVDNNDAATRDELARMAALRREQLGCAPGALDLDSIRQRLDRAARTRPPRRR